MGSMLGRQAEARHWVHTKTITVICTESDVTARYSLNHVHLYRVQLSLAPVGVLGCKGRETRLEEACQPAAALAKPDSISTYKIMKCAI